MNMQVAKNSVVTLEYHVTDPDGEVVDEGREPIIYLHGGYDDIFPKIEESLQGKTVGESVQVKLQPDEAFGDYDAELVQVESRKDFPAELQVGMQFEGGPEDGGDEDLIIYRVTEIADGKVVLDGNHPLAGMALVFTCTVAAIRNASAEEIEHGHVHSGGDSCE
ncbi:MAG: peptidylprolyl isomerase [Betaproteobacteria bacterium]|nr:peptidylprolyl isomerase [Betaproteobacteria bacterium]